LFLIFFKINVFMHNFYYFTNIYVNIALMLPNIPELTIAILSAASLGVISVLLNPAYQLTEIEFMLKKTSPKGLMMLDNLKTLQHYDILNKICPELEKSQKGELSSKQLPNLKHVILVRNKLVETKADKYKGVWFLEELEKYNSPIKALPSVDIDDSFIMMFTVIFKIIYFNSVKLILINFFNKSNRVDRPVLCFINWPRTEIKFFN